MTKRFNSIFKFTNSLLLLKIYAMLKLTLDFLSELKENNNKPWFEAHKAEFEKAKAEFVVFITQVLEGIKSFDAKIEGLSAKDGIYRIYRDVRFSTDKTPYKTHFGAYFAEGGKKSLGPGYYIHVEPASIFVGGGIYMPESPILQKIRQEIDYNGEKLMAILEKPSFKRYFPNLMSEGKLSRPPKGYQPENEFIELLKLKSVVSTYAISSVQTNELTNEIVNALKELYSLQEFLREAIA